MKTYFERAAPVLSAIAARDPIHGPTANYFQHPSHDPTPKSQAILVKADQVADEAGLDDELVGGLVVGLRPE